MITKYLQDCIKHLPVNRWFESNEVPAHVSRRDWVCRRLVEEGVVQQKVEWKVDNEKGMANRTDFRMVCFYFLKN